MKNKLFKKIIGLGLAGIFILLSCLFQFGASKGRGALTGAYAGQSGDENCSTIYVYVFYNPKDTIILQNREANYPEVAFITVVAVAKDNSTNKFKLYKDGSLSFKLHEYSKDYLADIPYKIYNLTDDYNLELGDLENILFDEFNTKVLDTDFDFFHALNDANKLRSALNNMGAQYSDIDNFEAYMINLLQRNLSDRAVNIKVGGSSRAYCVLAVASWGVADASTSIVLDISRTPVDEHPRAYIWGLKDGGVYIKGNVDNVNFFRENEPTLVQSGFFSSPGRFIISKVSTGTGAGVYAYDQIIEAKMREARGEIPAITGGGGPDWLQLAAADICNNNLENEVLNTVWHIKTFPNNSIFFSNTGSVNLKEPLTVNLNSNESKLRYNSDGVRSTYGFTINKYRDEVIWHESLHAFENYYGTQIFTISDESRTDPRLPIYDVDDDQLYVGDHITNAEHPYFHFEWDHKNRGWYNSLTAGEIVRKFDAGQLDDCWGDQVSAVPMPYFMTRIDNQVSADKISDLLYSGVTPDGQPILTIPANIPLDFPFDVLMILDFHQKFSQDNLYSLNQNDPPGYNPFSFQLCSAKLTRVPYEIKSGEYGYYVTSRFFINFYGNFSESSDETDRDIRDYYIRKLGGPLHQIRLYAVNNVSNNILSYDMHEFDAEVFGITGGQGFSALQTGTIGNREGK